MLQGRPDACTVLINCSEKGRLRLNTGTYVTGTEGHHQSYAISKADCYGRCMLLCKVLRRYVRISILDVTQEHS